MERYRKNKSSFKTTSNVNKTDSRLPEDISLHSRKDKKNMCSSNIPISNKGRYYPDRTKEGTWDWEQ